MNPERDSHMEHRGEDAQLATCKADLRAVLFDRRRAADHGAAVPAHVELPQIPAEMIPRVAANMRLLSMLNGHPGSGIRHLLRKAATPEMAHLVALQEWSKKLVTADASLPEEMMTPPPALLEGVRTANELLERLAFSSRYEVTDEKEYVRTLASEVAEALEAPSGMSWDKLATKAFPGGKDAAAPLHSMIERLGFIPSVLTSTETFATSAPLVIADAVRALRQIERDDRVPYAPDARRERARLLDRMIISGMLAKATRPKESPVTIDNRGIWLNASALKMHEHLPFGLASDETRVALVSAGLLTPSEASELAVRMADEKADPAALEAAMEVQMRVFADAYGGDQKLREDIRNKPEQVARWCGEKKMIIPDAALEALLGNRSPDAVFATLRFAEAVEAHLVGEKLSREPRLLTSHELLGRKKETYDARESVLHDPRIYSAGKAMRALFASEVPPSDPKGRYLAFRGGYRDSHTAGHHVFVETVLRDRVARVLIEPEATLNDARLRNLEKLPDFERSSYEPLEDALRTFEYFASTIEAMPAILASKRRGWEERYREMAETGLHFLLTNVTRRYADAERAWRAIPKGDSLSPIDAEPFHAALRKAAQAYGDFLYENAASPEALRESFSPEVRKADISFGESFCALGVGRVAEGGCDERLSRAASPVRVVTISYKTADTTEAIPYHVELSALDALRLDRKRPLINVLGGARFSDALHDDAGDPLHRIAAAVILVGHEVKANIAVPGTQSGLGLAFGNENVHYANRVAELPKAEKAHLFAVTPAGHTFYPGNDLLAGQPDQTYALNAVDSILTPFPAGWTANPEEYRSSPYHQHIAYMESLFNRVSHDQPKTLVVGNGGYWSVLEAVESLKHGFDMLLIKGSGRFADAAATALEAMTAAEIAAFTTDAAFDAALLEHVHERMTAAAAEDFLQKDFGPDLAPRNLRDELYRELFRRFVREASVKRDTVGTTTIDALEGDLRALLRKKNDGT